MAPVSLLPDTSSRDRLEASLRSAGSEPAGGRGGSSRHDTAQDACADQAQSKKFTLFTLSMPCAKLHPATGSDSSTNGGATCHWDAAL